MTRIIAGVARGRRLSVPGRGTRPTSDRVRESLFSSLDSELSAAGIPWNSVAVLARVTQLWITHSSLAH